MAREVEEEIGKIKFEHRYHPEFPGEYQERQQSRKRLFLLTAVSIPGFLIPLIYRGNLPGHEIEYPMAVVIVGGLVTSTLLNLFLMPALFLRFGRTTPRCDPGT